MNEYDFSQPSTLPRDTVFVVRRGVAWMTIGNLLVAEWHRTKDEAMARAHALASERRWNVEYTESPGDDLPWNR